MNLALNPGSGPTLAYVKRHSTSVRRDRATWTLLTAGLGGQLVGVATQGLWHGLLAGRTSGMLTEDRAFWIDHTISNAGVVCLTVGGILLHRRCPSLATRAVLAGTAAETLGALLDAYAHTGKRESGRVRPHRRRVPAGRRWRRRRLARATWRRDEVHQPGADGPRTGSRLRHPASARWLIR